MFINMYIVHVHLLVCIPVNTYNSIFAKKKKKKDPELFSPCQMILIVNLYSNMFANTNNDKQLFKFYEVYENMTFS